MGAVHYVQDCVRELSRAARRETVDWQERVDPFETGRAACLRFEWRRPWPSPTWSNTVFGLTRLTRWALPAFGSPFQDSKEPILQGACNAGTVWCHPP
jgi:hypothetical protein